ncbi:hypothetical protein ACLI4Y_07320 [Natrialbaceae archaeon A-CW3]
MHVVSKLAVVLVVVGAVLLAGPVFGFTTIGADRGVSIDTADTESALLAITSIDETPNNQEDAVVLEITNNANVDFDTLETTVDLDDDNNALEISESFDTDLDSGAQTGLEVTCARGGTGVATVTVEAYAGGNGLQIDGVTASHTFSYSCTGGGNTGGGFQTVSASDVRGSTPATQEFSFVLDDNIGNEEEITIWFYGSAVNYDEASIAEFTVDGSTSNDHIGFSGEGTTGTITITAQGNLKGGDEVRVLVDGVDTTDDWGWGFAVFSESGGNDVATDGFTTSSGLATTASTDGETTTVTTSDLEQVPIEESDTLDSIEELAALLDGSDGVIVDDAE